MKRLFLIIVLVLFLSSLSHAQEYKTALGLRAGFPYGATLKHFLNKTNALEGILAWKWNGIVVTGFYENEHWTGQYPALNWFWGFGAHVGFWDQGNNPYLNDYTGVAIGADAIIGLEYTFDEIPLNLSLDILPTFNIIGNTGWGGLNGGLSIRYVF